eukprot:364380-Chlamydomonas_euryale.AAC.3
MPACLYGALVFACPHAHNSTRHHKTARRQPPPRLRAWTYLNSPGIQFFALEQPRREARGGLHLQSYASRSVQRGIPSGWRGIGQLAHVERAARGTRAQRHVDAAKYAALRAARTRPRRRPSAGHPLPCRSVAPRPGVATAALAATRELAAPCVRRVRRAITLISNAAATHPGDDVVQVAEGRLGQVLLRQLWLVQQWVRALQHCNGLLPIRLTHGASLAARGGTTKQSRVSARRQEKQGRSVQPQLWSRRVLGQDPPVGYALVLLLVLGLPSRLMRHAQPSDDHSLEAPARSRSHGGCGLRDATERQEPVKLSTATRGCAAADGAAVSPARLGRGFTLRTSACWGRTRRAAGRTQGGSMKGQ